MSKQALRHGTPHTPDGGETRERVFACLSLLHTWAVVDRFVGSGGLKRDLVYIRGVDT